MPKVKFDANYDEMTLILEIVNRALLKHPGLFRNMTMETMAMDLDACHSNGCPLDFQKLLGFPPFDFAHDLSGIKNHINRETGKLERGFLPRCAKANEKENA